MHFCRSVLTRTLQFKSTWWYKGCVILLLRCERSWADKIFFFKLSNWIDMCIVFIWHKAMSTKWWNNRIIWKSGYIGGNPLRVNSKPSCLHCHVRRSLQIIYLFFDGKYELISFSSLIVRLAIEYMWVRVPFAVVTAHENHVTLFAKQMLNTKRIVNIWSRIRFTITYLAIKWSKYMNELISVH